MDLNHDMTKKLLDNYLTLEEAEKEDSDSSSDTEGEDTADQIRQVE